MGVMSQLNIVRFVYFESCISSNQNDKDLLGCYTYIKQIMNVFHSCNNENIFIRWKMECYIQLGSASLKSTFHLSTHQNIRTIALINIHYLYSINWKFYSCSWIQFMNLFTLQHYVRSIANINRPNCFVDLCTRVAWKALWEGNGNTVIVKRL